MRLPLAILLMIASQASAETYVYAKQGTLKLGIDHGYITERQFDSPTSVVGVGYVFHNTSVEFGFHNLGTFRAVFEKPVTVWRNFTIDLPGYAELRATGISAGIKYQTPIGLYLKASAAHVTAQAELDTPIGYRLYEKKAWLPMAEIGAKVGQIEAGGMWLPGLSGFSIGVQARF